LAEQVENLQHLWKEQNLRVEKLESQNQSLQRLNQELSMTINRYRKDLRDLREQSDTTRLREPKTEEAKPAPDLVDKIDKVLAGLQT